MDKKDSTREGKGYMMKVLIRRDGDQAQENMEATHQVQEEVEAQMEDAHGGQSPP